MKNELAKQADLHLAAPQGSVASMLEMVIKGGITQESVGAFKELVQLHREEMGLQAEREFAAAFIALQSEMPNVQATKVVRNSEQKGGGIRYAFVPYEELMKQLSPLLQKHRFTVSFSTDYTPTAPCRIVQTCTLQHEGGHKRDTKFAARVGAGPQGTSEAQADAAAGTLCKRYALCNALNIVCVGMDNDARLEGGTLSPEKCDGLKQRFSTLSNLKADAEAKFLKYAHAESWETIPESSWAQLDRFLTEKGA